MRQGFTLMELIIITAILAIIAASAAALLGGSSESAKAKKLRIAAGYVETAVEQYRLIGLDSDAVAAQIAKTDYTFAEKVIGSIPYLITARKQETSSSDFCTDTSGSEGTGYRYLKALNGGSAAGIHAHTAVGSMNVPTGSGVKALCLSAPGVSDSSFAVAVKATDDVWACGRYSGNALLPHYFIAASGSGRVFKTDCFITGGTFTLGNLNTGFFIEEADVYNRG